MRNPTMMKFKEAFGLKFEIFSQDLTRHIRWTEFTTNYKCVKHITQVETDIVSIDVFVYQCEFIKVCLDLSKSYVYN